jgi:hypothetical protein
MGGGRPHFGEELEGHQAFVHSCRDSVKYFINFLALKENKIKIRTAIRENNTNEETGGSNKKKNQNNTMHNLLK